MTGDAPIALDESRALAAALGRAADALDRDIAASAAVDRIAGRVMARLAERRQTRRSIWFAVAAALIIAAGLGSLADLALIGARSGPYAEVVVMDPLIFGTAVVDRQ